MSYLKTAGAIYKTLLPCGEKDVNLGDLDREKHLFQKLQNPRRLV